jgi:hypothetical protein
LGIQILAGLLGGVNAGGLGNIVGGLAGRRPADGQVVQQLNALGVLSSIPKLIGTLRVLIEFASDNAHVQYETNRAFGGRTGVEVAIGLVNEIA